MSPASGSATGGTSGASGSKRSSLSSPETETNARSGTPAKTTSAGSSPVASVATTRIPTRSTMLTVSETWLTTHASVAPRARTDTGSTPTVTDPA